MSSPISEDPKVRIGILGSGWMGSVHAECYRQIRDAKVVGVFGRNRDRAEAAAKICDAKPVLDVSALLDDPNVDAIDVCLPSVNHEEVVIKAFERGKPVFCETPFALKFTEAETMLKAAKDAGQSEFNFRRLHRLRRFLLLGKGGLGEVETAQVLNCLKAGKCERGFLINFGTRS
jgi:predicted dehydrogenase